MDALNRSHFWTPLAKAQNKADALNRSHFWTPLTKAQNKVDALNRSHFWTPPLESQAQDKVISFISGPPPWSLRPRIRAVSFPLNKAKPESFPDTPCIGLENKSVNSFGAGLGSGSRVPALGFWGQGLAFGFWAL